MNVIPFESVGDIRFGETRTAIRGLLKGGFESFRKGPIAETLTDAYDSLGLHLYFDTNDCLEFVEAFKPAIITFTGIDFLGRKAAEVAELLQKCGFGSVEVDGGIEYESIGLEFTVDEGIVEGVGISSASYFAERNERVQRELAEFLSRHPPRSAEVEKKFPKKQPRIPD